MAFGADNRHLTTTGYDDAVRIWKTDSTTEPLVLDGFRAPVLNVASLTDDRYVTAHIDGTIRIWRCPACGTVTEVLATASQRLTRELTAAERHTYLSANP